MLTLSACVLATLATPAGLHLWEFAWQDKQTVMQYVDDEWAPFHLVWSQNAALTVEAWLAVLATIAVVGVTWIAVGVALNGTRDRLRSPLLPAPSRVLLALATFAGGLAARRFHWLHVITLVLCLEMLVRLARGGAFAALVRRAEGRAARTAALGAGLALAAVLGVTALDVEGRSVPRSVLTADYWTRPVARAFELPGVDFLAQAGIEGDAVCHYGSGGILTYRLFPKVRVLIDSRIDLYRRAIYLDYLAIRNGRRDQQQLLDRYGADVYYRHWSLPPPVDPDAWILVWTRRDEGVWLRRGAARTPENLERARRWHAAHGRTFPAAAAAPR